ncbi:hypothetical protein CPLU01_04128 [Colletotrichum plurivorum]|uniref:Uncharacterized protein n=1 Tax=Colletotrichum plurivorum TaxID=2175906 RepID=A0A8H6KRC0_9PEZI|nr:hypothetical protein CPLU01_04128 [Colletotrichum plurivorum]
MSVLNPFISNGTCYFGPGKPAAEEWFPCGNAELGDKTCCQRGDMCLSSKACYNGRYGITYLAGCSDPEYQDPSCPEKGSLDDHPWTGLVYCNGTSEEWVACEQAAKPTTLTSADACWCPQTSRTVAFTDSSVLENIVQLPTVLGGSVIWQPGHVPLPTQVDTTTTTTTPAAVTTTSEATTGTIPTISPTSTGLVVGDSQAELASSKRIGIGVGVGAGCAVLLGVLVFLFFARRKLQRHHPMELENTKAEGGSGYGNGFPTPATTTISELEPTAARPWSVRTELDGTPRSSTTGLADAYGFKTQEHTYHSHFGREPSPKSARSRWPPSPIAELPG